MTTTPKRMTSREYREVYLRSEHWAATRLQALDAADYRCRVCNAEHGLDVHHRTYERLGAERPDDLTVLCRRCHSRFHDVLPKVGEPKARKPKAEKARGRRQRKMQRKRDNRPGAHEQAMSEMRARNAKRSSAA